MLLGQTYAGRDLDRILQAVTAQPDPLDHLEPQLSPRVRGLGRGRSRSSRSAHIRIFWRVRRRDPGKSVPRKYKSPATTASDRPGTAHTTRRAIWRWGRWGRAIAKSVWRATTRPRQSNPRSAEGARACVRKEIRVPSSGQGPSINRSPAICQEHERGSGLRPEPWPGFLPSFDKVVGLLDKNHKSPSWDLCHPLPAALGTYLLGKRSERDGIGPGLKRDFGPRLLERTSGRKPKSGNLCVSE